MVGSVGSSFRGGGGGDLVFGAAELSALSIETEANDKTASLLNE